MRTFFWPKKRNCEIVKRGGAEEMPKRRKRKKGAGGRYTSPLYINETPFFCLAANTRLRRCTLGPFYQVRRLTMKGERNQKRRSSSFVAQYNIFTYLFSHFIRICDSRLCDVVIRVGRGRGSTL